MQHSSRRSFLTKSVGASAFTIIRPELVRGAGKERLKAGLVGCGGRGTQAVTNLLGANGNVDLVAMGDMFEDRVSGSRKTLARAEFAAFRSQIKVDPEHCFSGFDAYKKVLASDIDIVMLCTPPVYRPEHFEAAVAARKHIFTEKPFAIDPVGVRRFMAAVKKSEELKLTVMAGTQRRSAPHYTETVRKIQDGVIGEIVAGYAYWLGGPITGRPRTAGMSDFEYQTRNWYSYLWLSGDHVVEQHLHNIDVINWVMGAHPVKVVSTGGVSTRPRDERHGNIYDHFSSDFEYANGVRMASYCRQYVDASLQKVEELVVGTKGRSNCQDLGPTGINGIVQEHVDMVNSILGTGPYINRGMVVAESTLTAIMARESAYTGQAITWDQIMNSQLDLKPKDLERTLQVSAPPPPVPGVYKLV